MNRYNFIKSKGVPLPPKLELLPRGSINNGQRWSSIIDGSSLTILGKNKDGSWAVSKTTKGNMRTHDNGESDMLENFILSFYKLA